MVSVAVKMLISVSNGPFTLASKSDFAWALKPVDAWPEPRYMDAIPNEFRVPAPVTSAWDLLRLRISWQGPASTGRPDWRNRRSEPSGLFAADMELGQWLV